MSADLKVLCAWCGTTLREGSEPPSHGICRACHAIYFPPKPGAPWPVTRVDVIPWIGTLARVVILVAQSGGEARARAWLAGPN